MTLAVRRYLYLFFISAFVVITTIVITYASGYSFFSGSKILVKTGMLILDTEPQGAKVTLNNKVQQNFFDFTGDNTITTPAKIKNLTPGEYLVQLELPGYNSWQKKLTILPGQATFAETVILFKKDTPVNLVNSDVADFTLSPDKKYLSVGSKNAIKIIDTKNSETIYETNSTSTSMKWSSDSKQLLLANNILIDTNKLSSSTLPIPNANNTTNWLSNNELGYINKGNLQIYNLLDQSTQIINANNQAKEVFTDFNNDDNNLYVIANTINNSDLLIFNKKTLKLEKKIKLPGLGYVTEEIRDKYLVLKNRKFNDLLIINPSENSPVVTKLTNFNKLVWLDNDNIYYSTEHELFALNLNQDKSTIIARISDPIIDLYLHPSNNYLLYTTKNAISSLELDDRDHHNISVLVSAQNLKKSTFDEKLLQFYYTATENNSTALRRFLTK
jgi:hypothetical protein